MSKKGIEEYKDRDYTSKIFIASVGVTPQIVTEALYYYATLDPPVYFDRVVLITTSKGEQKIKRFLFKEEHLSKLENFLRLEKGFFPLSEDDIIVLRDGAGKPLRDIRTSQDTEDVMVQVFQLMKDLSQEEETKLIVTVAGGRKTMSVTMGLAMSLYGRSQDEMIHIIIPDELFWNENWFFPTDPNDPDQKIEVSNLPYLRSGKYLQGLDISNPTEAIEIAQSRIDEIAPITQVILDGKKMIVEAEDYAFPSSVMMIWRYLARKKTEHCVRLDLKYCGDCTECYVDQNKMIDDFYGEMGEEYRLCVGEHSSYWYNFNARSHYDIDKTIRENRSKLKKIISTQVRDPRIHKQAQITEIRDPEDLRIKKYGLVLDKSSIKFTD